MNGNEDKINMLLVSWQRFAVFECCTENSKMEKDTPRMTRI
jgi:hypothetical protein